MNVTSACVTAECDAILVTEIFCYRYSTFNNFGKKEYFSMNLEIASGVYWKVIVRKFI